MTGAGRCRLVVFLVHAGVVPSRASKSRVLSSFSAHAGMVPAVPTRLGRRRGSPRTRRGGPNAYQRVNKGTSSLRGVREDGTPGRPLGGSLRACGGGPRYVLYWFGVPETSPRTRGVPHRQAGRPTSSGGSPARVLLLRCRHTSSRVGFRRAKGDPRSRPAASRQDVVAPRGSGPELPSSSRPTRVFSPCTGSSDEQREIGRRRVVVPAQAGGPRHVRFGQSQGMSSPRTRG